jgi:hypothetical protein
MGVRVSPGSPDPRSPERSVVRKASPAGPGVVSKTKRRETYGVRFVSLPHSISISFETAAARTSLGRLRSLISSCIGSSILPRATIRKARPVAGPALNACLVQWQNGRMWTGRREVRSLQQVPFQRGAPTRWGISDNGSTPVLHSSSRDSTSLFSTSSEMSYLS